MAGLTLGTNGNFYGTTVNGGADGAGTVFEVTSNGVLATLYSFTGGNDGAEPEAGLTGGTNGIFYGITSFGGSGGYGTVFAVMASGGLTTLYTFKDGDDGAGSFAALTSGLNGNFYGTTAGDEDSTYGNVFEVTPGGALTNLYSFTNGNDSASPDAALTLGPDDNFYGTTYGNFSGTPFDSGSNPWGTVFEVMSNGAFATLVSFAGTNGENSKGNLVPGAGRQFLWHNFLRRHEWDRRSLSPESAAGNPSAASKPVRIPGHTDHFIGQAFWHSALFLSMAVQ